jgi:hypothetical protein
MYSAKMHSHKEVLTGKTTSPKLSPSLRFISSHRCQDNSVRRTGNHQEENHMKEAKKGALGKMLSEIAADDVAASSSSVPQPSASGTNGGTNGKVIMYTPEEQERAARLKMLMSASDKSTAEEGKEWYEERELKKDKQQRFKLFYESLGADKDRVYYAIRVYEDSLVKAAAMAIPPSIEQEATKAGIELSKPEQKNAVARAIVGAKLKGEPTHKQVISIIKNAGDDIDAAAESGEKEEFESEEEHILASLNAIFTSSYERVVGVPKYEKDRKTKVRRFVGYVNPHDVLINVAVSEWTDEEKAWVKTMEGTLKNITGLGGYDTWASGGPDLGNLGRGEDQFTFADINQQKKVA